MNMRKRRLWLAVAAALSVTILALVIVLTHNSSPEYKRYKEWAKTLKVHDWDMTKDTPPAFAEANCKGLTLGHPPAFRIRSEDHLKATSAILYAYCPDAVSPYLKSVDKQYGDEYSETTEFIRKAGR